MLLQCPRCRAVQDDTARTCTKCGEPLTPPPVGPDARPPGRRFGRSRSDVFQFAAPVPVAEVEQTAILPTPHPPARPAPPPRAPRKPPRTPAVAAGLALAAALALFLSFRHALPRLVHPAPRPAARLGTSPASPDGLTLVTSRPTGHVPAGSPVTVTASTPSAPTRSAHVSLFAQRGAGPSRLFSAAQGSECRATWTPTAPGHYVLTATVQGDLTQPLTSRSLKITVDPAKAPPPARPRRPHNTVIAQFPRRRTAAALANRLMRRGIPAQVRPTLGRSGLPVYQVEAGIHSRSRSTQLPGIM